MTGQRGAHELARLATALHVVARDVGHDYAAGSTYFAISAVNTGMPALLASPMAEPMACESYGVRTIAATFLRDEVFDLALLF